MQEVSSALLNVRSLGEEPRPAGFKDNVGRKSVSSISGLLWTGC